MEHIFANQLWQLEFNRVHLSTVAFCHFQPKCKRSVLYGDEKLLLELYLCHGVKIQV